MKASSGGQYSSPQEGRRGGEEGLTVGCLILLSYRARCIIPARLYQEERSLSGDSSKEHACGSLILSYFLFLIQLVSVHLNAPLRSCWFICRISYPKSQLCYLPTDYVLRSEADVSSQTCCGHSEVLSHRIEASDVLALTLELLIDERLHEVLIQLKASTLSYWASGLVGCVLTIWVTSQWNMFSQKKKKTKCSVLRSIQTILRYAGFI